MHKAHKYAKNLSVDFFGDLWYNISVALFTAFFKERRIKI